jgi:serine/threonine protein kinase
VTLIDFGLAEQVNEARESYVAGGTLHAMSPEMLRLFVKQAQQIPTNESVSANTDIYSLGVLLLEIIQSSLIHYVHKSQHNLQQYLKLREMCPYSLPQHSDFSPKFRKFMQLVLEPNPKLRPTSESIWLAEWLDADTVARWRQNEV